MNNDIDKKEQLMEGRRAFMRGASLLLTGTAAYALTPNFAWAESDKLEGLTQVCYAMYPHRHVPIKFYKACAQGLLDKAAGDSALAAQLNDGLAALDAVYSSPFHRLSDDDKELALQRLATMPFFQTVRGHTVVGLYNIPDIWQYFGYQGPSFPKGGYIDRGLNDIFWLNDV